MTTDRIVEAYSAANSVEAQCVADLLEEAGIANRIVGEALGNAGGALPLGLTIAPKIWVHEADAPLAREIIAQWNSRPFAEPAEIPESEAEIPEPEVAGQPQEPASPGDQRFHFSSGLFVIAGLACALFGVVGAFEEAATLRRYSADTQARLVDVWESVGYEHNPGDRNLPIPQKEHYSPRVFHAQYVYTVDHSPYRVDLKEKSEPRQQITILYNPQNPSDRLVGARMPPWWIALYALGAGAFLMFIGFRFR